MYLPPLTPVDRMTGGRPSAGIRHGLCRTSDDLSVFVFTALLLLVGCESVVSDHKYQKQHINFVYLFTVKENKHSNNLHFALKSWLLNDNKY